MDDRFSSETVIKSIDLEWEQQRAWVEIDRAALVHNVRQVRSLLKPDTQMMAVVKADAYGHGAIDVARTLVAAGVDWLAVATVPEGIELRAAGIVAPILLLGAIHTDIQVRAIVQWNLQPTICTIPQAITISKSVAALNLDKPLNIHLKLDTGMSRLGANWQQAETFYREVSSLPYLKIGSLYSHLATADAIDRTVMDMQLDRFARSIAAIENAGYAPPLLHLANSAGILTTDRSHYQLVRPGLILYGLCPAPHLQSKIDLQPVLSVKARVSQVKEITAGTGVSYGYRFIADRDMQIAVIEIGYADGVPRRLSNRMQAIVRGQLVPQIGTITMDRLMLDVSQIPDLQVDEIVTILGRDGSVYISADDWANEVETISWEILCGFKPRLPRANKDEEPKNA
ncbi:alanine racemase [Chamaesiphon minutus]|uniref:Alanine racemase n=1 Tax=Chamaesiphon minutus (strain ATCC 27169 / PCC 6605) TaxID=1173020 RepID=K9UIX0_CHAP6|nr:alanine racemase [Chamaesiphon minutus]AFY94608.1 alanine racemase [Chamaesiphon minutus PCC 6605]